MDLPPDDQDLISHLETLANGTGAPAVVPETAQPAKVPAAPGAVTPAEHDPIAACLIRLEQLPVGDIPGLIWALAPLEQKAAGWSPSHRSILSKIQELCDQLIQEKVVDVDIAFASIHKLARSLRSDLMPQLAVEPVAVQPVAASPMPLAVAPPVAVAADAGRNDKPASDVLDDFAAETGDLLSEVETLLLPGTNLDGDGIAALFRAFHTIKGMGAYLSLPRIEALAHGVEGRLAPVRDGTQPQDAAMRNLAMAGVDGLRALASHIRSQRGDKGALPAAAMALAGLLGMSLVDPEPAGDLAGETVPRIGDILEEQGIPRPVIEQAAAALAPGDRLGDKLVQQGNASREEIEEAAAKQQAVKTSGDGFTRVSIGRLDELMNMVGELLIAQAMVGQEATASGSTRLSQMVSSQARILRNLQVLSLSLRMVPLKGLFQKMARAIHDTSRKVGKDIEFRMVGDDTEIDRTLAETLADPLMHMVRNAVDHGIDNAEERARRGKPAKGVVTLSAGHAGDAVVLTLSDDGRGMDPEKLRAKAVKLGLVPPDKQLTEQEAYQLIFLPGFSTAEQVTGISGRGVGMDVVRRNISAMKGQVEIASTLGTGTTFTIRLPLTTAILDAMVLKVGAERFLIPLSAIVHALRPTTDQVKSVLGQGRVIESRGELLSVVSLAEQFAITGAIAEPENSILVVFEHFGGRIALHVDDILGQQQVVIKPLDRQYAHHAGLAGSSILGDGRVGLILDPAHLVAVAKSAAA
jgi:two-component system chemotaxis sensor kinase CheA